MWQQNTNRMNLVLSEEIHLKLQSKHLNTSITHQKEQNYNASLP